MTDATDCHLLERFVTLRDEAAFATLARRHAALVLGVCRRVLRDEHAAEDVVQATFLVLARKAVVIPWRQSVGGWLAAVAHRLALNARAAAARRGCRERSAGILLHGNEEFVEPALLDADPLRHAARQELRGVLHEELSRLPEKYRAPVVLCYLEGKTNEQAARELGWPTGSMSRRLERARKLLRERLTRRGVGLMLVFVGVTLAAFWTCFRPENRCPAPAGAGAVLSRAANGLPAEAERLVALADVLRSSDEMSAPARDLASAARSGDRRTTRVAAGRLYAACSRCHETVRE